MESVKPPAPGRCLCDHRANLGARIVLRRLKLFVLAFAACTGALWGMSEATSFFAGDKFKLLVGDRWWLVYLVAPAVIAVFMAFRRGTRESGRAVTPDVREVSYAVNYTRIAWSADPRVTLLYSDEEPTFAASIRAIEARVKRAPLQNAGRPIEGLAASEVRFWNTGTRPLRDLNVRLRIARGKERSTLGLPLRAATAEILRWQPLVDFDGPTVSLQKRGTETLEGTCDLLNPRQSFAIEVIATAGPFYELTDRPLDVAVVGEGVPPAVECA